MEYIVYKHTSPSGKCYIGMTCQTMERRARCNGRAYSQCTAFYGAIQKYGWDNFDHEILESGLSYEDACEKERYYIALFHSLTSERGYNLETGGGANTTVSEETKKKISEKLTGRKGTPHTPESKRKLREAHLGKTRLPFSEETRKKLSLSLTGRTFTPEHRANISRSKSGSATSGKNNSHPRPVLCVETGVIFDTVKEAGEFKGGSSKNIIACCRGRLKTSGGYHWRYADEEV